MKKVLFIGKFNINFQDVYKYLGQYFNVQMCVDKHDVVRDMLKVNSPDVVLISLIQISADADNIMTEIQLNYPNLHVVCIGTETEQEPFVKFFEKNQFITLTRPIPNSIVVDTLCRAMGVTFDGVRGLVRERRSGRKTVMLVDDSPLHLRAMNEIMKKKYDVQLANSGMKALTMLGQKLPDIIFLDYDMPVCDGKMTFQMIKELDEAKNIPVIFLTGVSDKEHINSVLSLRPAGYLLKPVNMDRIEHTIQEILGK